MPKEVKLDCLFVCSDCTVQLYRLFQRGTSLEKGRDDFRNVYNKNVNDFGAVMVVLVLWYRE